MNADLNNMRENDNERSVTTKNTNNTHSNPNATNVTNSSNNSNIGNNSTTLHQPNQQQTGINRNMSTRTMRSRSDTFTQTIVEDQVLYPVSGLNNERVDNDVFNNNSLNDDSRSNTPIPDENSDNFNRFINQRNTSMERTRVISHEI